MAHHGRGLTDLLARAGRPADEIATLLDTLAHDPAHAPVAPADAALIAYALKLTRTPAAMTGDDVAALRAHGFDDRAIHDLCAVTAYFAFVNRIADGLGVELEG